MENGIYIVKLNLRDEYEIAELFNGTWNTFRSLSQKYSEKDVIYCELNFVNPAVDAQFTVSFPEDEKETVK